MCACSPTAISCEVGSLLQRRNIHLTSAAVDRSVSDVQLQQWSQNKYHDRCGMTTHSPTNDSKVSSLIDRHIASTNAKTKSIHASKDDADPDALFAELEAEDDSAFRAARAQQLASELSKLRPSNAAVQVAAEAYVTLRSDDEVLRFTTNTDKCLLHFLHPEFARCAVMDSHLQKLAERHSQYNDGDVKVGKINVRDASFVVDKLGVRVLPCVIGFVAGVAKGRIVGFEGVAFGGRESGTDVTQAIEQAAIGWGVFERRLFVDTDGGEGSASEEEQEVQRKSGRRGIQGSKKNVQEDDDDEWD